MNMIQGTTAASAHAWERRLNAAHIRSIGRIDLCWASLTPDGKRSIFLTSTPYSRAETSHALVAEVVRGWSLGPSASSEQRESLHPFIVPFVLPVQKGCGCTTMVLREICRTEAFHGYVEPKSKPSFCEQQPRGGNEDYALLCRNNLRPVSRLDLP